MPNSMFYNSLDVYSFFVYTYTFTTNFNYDNELDVYKSTKSLKFERFCIHLKIRKNSELTEKLNQLLAASKINKASNDNIQLQLFMVHGILIFISLSYQAGFLKPTTQVKANEFLALLNTATAELSLDTKNNIANNNYDPLENNLAEKVARSLFSALRPVKK
jgi:hypothetical protein